MVGTTAANVVRKGQTTQVGKFFFSYYYSTYYYTIPSDDNGYQCSHVNTFQHRHVTSAQRYNVATSSPPHRRWTPHHHLLIDHDVPDHASCIVWAFQLVSFLSYLTIILFTYNSLFFGQQTVIIATSSPPKRRLTRRLGSGYFYYYN